MAKKQTVEAQVKTAALSPVLFALLNHPRVKEVRYRLTDGATCDEVAQFIQSELLLFDTLDVPTLVTYVQKFRDSIPKWEFRTQEGDFAAPIVEAAIINGTIQRLDLIAEAENLYRTQRMRVDREVTLESLTEKFNPFLGKEVDRANNLIKTLAVLYGDVGLATRNGAEAAAAAEAQGPAQVYGTPEVKEVFEAPESRRKVLLMGEGLAGIMARRKKKKEAAGVVDAPGEAVPGPHGPSKAGP